MIGNNLFPEIGWLVLPNPFRGMRMQRNYTETQ